MAFLVRYPNPVTLTVLNMHPMPTSVVYPERYSLKTRESRDGITVISRPIFDGRTRQWIWEKYRSTTTGYAGLWATLQSLDTKDLYAATGITTVDIWEDESGEDLLGRTTGGAPDLNTFANLIWTKVKFIKVVRELRKGGGPPTFDSSFIEWVRTP